MGCPDFQRNARSVLREDVRTEVDITGALGTAGKCVGGEIREVFVDCRRVLVANGVGEVAVEAPAVDEVVRREPFRHVRHGEDLRNACVTPCRVEDRAARTDVERGQTRDPVGTGVGNRRAVGREDAAVHEQSLLLALSVNATNLRPRHASAVQHVAASHADAAVRGKSDRRVHSQLAAVFHRQHAAARLADVEAFLRHGHRPFVLHQQMPVTMFGKPSDGRPPPRGERTTRDAQHALARVSVVAVLADVAVVGSDVHRSADKVVERIARGCCDSCGIIPIGTAQVERRRRVDV